jgi:hypothetical protein
MWLPERSEGTCARRSRRTVWSEQSASTDTWIATPHMRTGTNALAASVLYTQKFCQKTEGGRRRKFRSEAGSSTSIRPYQPSDEQSDSVAQVELRTLAASKIQVPACRIELSNHNGRWSIAFVVIVPKRSANNVWNWRLITIWGLRREWSLQWIGPWGCRSAPCRWAGQGRSRIWRAHDARAETLCHKNEFVAGRE